MTQYYDRYEEYLHLKAEILMSCTYTPVREQTLAAIEEWAQEALTMHELTSYTQTIYDSLHGPLDEHAYHAVAKKLRAAGFPTPEKERMRLLSEQVKIKFADLRVNTIVFYDDTKTFEDPYGWALSEFEKKLGTAYPSGTTLQIRLDECQKGFVFSDGHGCGAVSPHTHAEIRIISPGENHA